MMSERQRYRLIAKIRKAEMILQDVGYDLKKLDEGECAEMIAKSLVNITVVRCDLEDPL